MRLHWFGLLPAVLSWLVWLFPSTALASSQDLFGYGGRCAAVAGACITETGSFENTYSNPAGIRSSHFQKEFALSYHSAFFDIRVEGVPSETVVTPERSGGVSFGTTFTLPLPGWAKERFALGLGMFLPDSSLIRAQIPPPGTPWMPIIGNRSETLGVHAGGSAQIGDDLSVGLGVKVLAELVGEIRVSPGETGALSSSIRDELLTTASPLAGVHWKIDPSWTLALVYRGEERGAFSLPIVADLGNSLPLEVPEIQIEGIAQFDPRQVATAVAWKLTPSLHVETGLQWRNWSAYPRPMEPATQASKPLPQPDFTDTWSPRVGAHYTLHLTPSWRKIFRGGYGFEPSPVPARTIGNAMLDSNRHVVSAGIDMEWAFQGGILQTSFFLSEHVLTHREQRIGETEDEVSSVSSEGTIFLLGTGLGVRFK